MDTTTAVLCFIFSIVSVQVQGRQPVLTKQWMTFTDFNVSSNWDQGYVPCGKVKATIPDKSPPVYVQMKSTLEELWLPINGQLVLGDDIDLSFSNDAKSDCGEAQHFPDFHYNATAPQSWWDPNNWAAMTDRVKDTSFRIDTERVPCRHDNVVFPRKHLYHVEMPDINITIESFKVNGHKYATNKFLEVFRKEHFWTKIFKESSPTASIKLGEECDDIKRGCACGNDDTEITEKVCAIERKRCARVRCVDYITPVGHCCRLCGTIMNVTRGGGFDLSNFIKTLNADFITKQTPGRPQVQLGTFVMSDGWLQLVLHDSTGAASMEVARRMMAAFRRDTSGHKYGVKSFNIILTTVSLPQTGQLPPASIAGIVMAVVVVLAIAILVVTVVVLRRRGYNVRMPSLPSMPSMPSLPSMPSMPSMPRYIRHHDPMPRTAAHIDPGFANPMYSTSRPFDDGEGMKEMRFVDFAREEQPTFDLTGGAGFSNPNYEAKNKKFKDPSKTDDSEPGSPADLDANDSSI